MSRKFQMVDNTPQSAVIKVVGVGGGGGNAVEHMVVQSIDGVDFIAANTDAHALKASNARTVLQLGTEMTKGLGAGADPDVGHDHPAQPADVVLQRCPGGTSGARCAGAGRCTAGARRAVGPAFPGQHRRALSAKPIVRRRSRRSRPR